MRRSSKTSMVTGKWLLLALAVLALVHHDYGCSERKTRFAFPGAAANDEQQQHDGSAGTEGEAVESPQEEVVEEAVAEAEKPEFKLGVYECENVGGKLRDQAEAQKPKEQGSTLQLCVDVIEPADIAVMEGIQSLKLRMRGKVGDAINQPVVKDGQVIPDSTMECSELLCFLQIPLQVQFFMTKGYIDISGKAKVATMDGKHYDVLQIKYSFQVVPPIPESILNANKDAVKESSEKNKETPKLDYDPNDPYDHPEFKRPDPRTMKHEFFSPDVDKPFPVRQEMMYWAVLAILVALLEWSFSGHVDAEEQEEETKNDSKQQQQSKKVVKKKVVKAS